MLTLIQPNTPMPSWILSISCLAKFNDSLCGILPDEQANSAVPKWTTGSAIDLLRTFAGHWRIFLSSINLQMRTFPRSETMYFASATLNNLPIFFCYKTRKRDSFCRAYPFFQIWPVRRPAWTRSCRLEVRVLRMHVGSTRYTSRHA